MRIIPALEIAVITAAAEICAAPLLSFTQAQIEDRLQPWRDMYPPLDALIRSGVEPSAALRRLGLTLWSEGDSGTAAKVLGEAAVFAPADFAIWLDLGFARRAAGQPIAALEAFEQAEQLNPQDARVPLAIGLIVKGLGDLACAESAFERALTIDANNNEAAYSLGLLCFDARRYAEAACYWRAALERGYRATSLWLGLGQCQFFLGEFCAAVHSLEHHLKTAPQDVEIAQRLAFIRFLDSAVREGSQAAIALYQHVAPSDAPSIQTLADTAVSLLSAYGYTSTALDIARTFPANVNDPVQRYHLAALSGEDIDRAPKDYVTAYFDRFAETFDTQMYEILQYNGPHKLMRYLKQAGGAQGVTLDIGCGTGVAGVLLRENATRLIGVDLSPNMLNKATDRGVYDELHAVDMVDFLATHPERFDCVFAADSLNYLGDLSAFIAAAQRGLRSKGLLAVTLESATHKPYTLQPSGRFAHAPKTFIVACIAQGFRLRARRWGFLRLEAHHRVNAAYIVLERD